MHKSYFTLLLLFLVFAGNAQHDSTSEQAVKLKLSVNYNSNLHYYGRTDSLRSSGLIPMAELWVHDAFYINAAPIFVSNQLTGTQYAGSVATVGYLKAAPKHIVHLYALKPFYTAESKLVQSAMKAQAGAAFSFLSKIVNIGIGGDVKYSNQLDYGATLSVDHLVRIQRGDNILVIDPTVTLNAGTQNFLRTFRQRKSSLLFPREEVVTERTQAFRVMSYEASVPLIYVFGKMQILATPAYVVPLNLQPAQENVPAEYGKPMMNITLGLKYTL